MYVNNVTFDILNIRHGIPQGYNFGHLLFLDFVNDVTTKQDTPKLIMYADDSNAFHKLQSKYTPGSTI